MLVIALQDDDPNYFLKAFPPKQTNQQTPHNNKQQTNVHTFQINKHQTKKLKNKIALLDNTISVTRLLLRTNLPPSYIQINTQKLTKLSEADQGNVKNGIDSINKAYLEHLERQQQILIEKLLLAKPTATPVDSKTFLNMNHKEWQHFTKITKKNPYLHPANPNQKPDHTPTISLKKNLPKFWTTELKQTTTKLIQNTLNPKTTPNTPKKNPQTPADAASTFSMIQLNKNLYYIDKTDHHLNISKQIIDTLSLGLNFIPVYPTNIVLDSFDANLEDFENRLNWNEFWNNQAQFPPKQNNNNFDILPKRLRSNFETKKAPKSLRINNFCKTIKEDFVLELKSTKIIDTHTQKNQSRNINTTIKFFKTHNQDILIKPADKGGAIVILSTEFYESSISKQLQEAPDFFEHINFDPTTTALKCINASLKRLKKLHNIPNNTFKYLLPNTEKTRCPFLYGLPKIHKKIVSFRPIVSGNEHATENISIFLDYILQPYSTNHPLYLKDVTQLLQIINKLKLKNPPNNNLLLFNLDVVNMYTNIPQEECINSVFATINNDPTRLHRNKTNYQPKLISQLLALVLHNNYFQFNGQFYQQKHGIAMGTPCACTISDIYICNLIEEALKNSQSQLRPIIYKQYRDDGFGIWPHGEAELLNFLADLNKHHPNIKFTLNYGKQIDFLDTTISINQFGTISTETFYKPTATFNYLHPNSNHPKHCKENIAISQTIRHVRNCSSFNTFLYHKNFLEHNLITRGYSPKLIKQKTKTIKYKRRNKYLQYLKKDQDRSENRIPLITTFNKTAPNLNKIMKKHLQLLNNDPTKINHKPRTAYRVLRSIGSKIIKAKYPLEPVQKPHQQPTNHSTTSTQIQNP